MTDEKLAALRERFREKAKERREAAHRAAPPPRYDDVFFEGVAWLNSLAEQEEP